MGKDFELPNLIFNTQQSHKYRAYNEDDLRVEHKGRSDEVDRSDAFNDNDNDDQIHNILNMGKMIMMMVQNL